MISKYIKFQTAVLLVGLTPACFCLPGSAEQPRTNTQSKVRSTASDETQKFTPQQQQALNAKRQKWLLAQRSESGGTGEGAWQLLHRPPDLPNLPSYTGTGAQFAEGLMYPNKPGGAAISVTYRAKESPDTVRGWYEDALANYHWKVQKSNDHNLLMASNGPNNVTVKVTPSKGKVYKTDLKITFKLAHK
ncbi:MAG: hypothetical protein SGJ27_01555 [Candidatus Melainabacteria bacterium]|nr:hypothetical protein [Candidatus Melainabacteria bacterium]